MNHRIPKGTKMACFVLYTPEIDTTRCPVGTAVRRITDFYDKFMDDGTPKTDEVFVNSWAVAGEHLIATIESLDRHASRAARLDLEIAVFIYGHAAEDGFHFRNQIISYDDIILAGNKVRGLSTLGLMGCCSGKNNLNIVPRFRVISFREEIFFNSVATFIIEFVNWYRAFRNQRESKIKSCKFALHQCINASFPKRDVILFAPQ